ncbi:MAG TPA: pyruvate kinase alpha/beta domain-containing protein [Bacillota bacterium]|nr:pyruvate kinase alpha/beta domain-containing protein [Bacillota bacterium]
MHWQKRGPANTEATLEAAVKRARELQISHMVVASNSGATAKKLSEAAQGLSIVCVTHQVGFAGPGVDEMDAEMRALLKERGVKLLTTTHLLGGVDRALRMKFQGVYPSEIVSSTLRLFGQGVKVCVEISVMALDAGLIPYGREIVAIGGSGSGADSACVIVPAHSHKFFDTVVKEIICMPREK